MRGFKHLSLCLVLCSFFSIKSVYCQSPEISKVDLRIGAGATFYPSGFLGASSVDYRLHDYISLTGLFQWALGPKQDMVVPSFGARLIMPRGILLDAIEVSALFTVGPVFREVNGFQNTHMGYATGLAADVYLNDFFSVGVTGLVNLTSSHVEDVFSSVYGHAGLHF